MPERQQDERDIWSMCCLIGSLGSWVLIIGGEESTLIDSFFLQFLMAGWLTGYSWRCDLVDFSQDPKALRVSFLSNAFLHGTLHLVLWM